LILLGNRIELLKKQYSSKVDELNGVCTKLEKQVHALTKENQELARGVRQQDEASASRLAQVKQESEALKKKQEEEITGTVSNGIYIKSSDSK